MIRTRKNEFVGFGKKKAKTDEVSAKDLKPLLAREVVYGKKAYKLDSVYMKDNTLTIHFETEIYSNKKPVKIETIFTIDFNGNLDDNNLVIYKEQSVYPKGAIHKEYELKPKKEIHNKHYNNLTDAADDCNNIIEKNIESLLKNVVRDGYKLNVGESLRSVCCLKEADKERTDVIVKVNGKWRIKGKKQKYWDAEYDTKADAQAALRAYWANKGESLVSRIRSLKARKLENKNIKEMAGRFDTKTRDGERIDVLYTGGDIELLLGGGNYGAYRVRTKITDKESLRKAIDKVMKMAGHNLMPAERDAIETEAEKHLSGMRESCIKLSANKRMITESAERLMLKPIAKLAYKHRGEDLKSFEEFLLNEPLGITEDEAALAIALKAKLDGDTRLNTWDTVFHLITDKNAHKRILDSYYKRPSSFETMNDLIQEALYMYWHDNLGMLIRALNTAKTADHEYALALMLPDAKINGNGDVESEMWERRKKSKKKSDNIEKKESLKSLRHGDMMLSYNGDEIDWDEFEEDVFRCLKIKNANSLILRYADEAVSDEEMEEEIVAEGKEALEVFYDSCQMRLQSEDSGDVAIFVYDTDEITNFDYKLCLE